jgi:hypothetical protein
MATPANSLQSAFDYANASLALEGLAVDAAQAARQQQVINGRMSFAEAIAAAVKEASQ